MDIYEAIYLRKSVRAFKDTEVPEEIITRILNAAKMAPSANNRQEWRFVVVRNQETRKKLAQAAFGQSFIAEAPLVIACCAETEENVMACKQLCYPIDVAIVVDHITLLAAAEGLGTCWIGAFSEDQVKKVLGIPKDIRVVTLLPIGFPQNPLPIEKYRLPLKNIVRYEHW